MEVNTEAEGRLEQAREVLHEAWYALEMLPDDATDYESELRIKARDDAEDALEEAVRVDERASLQEQIAQLRTAVEASVWYAQMVIIPPSPDWRAPAEYTAAQVRAYDLGMKALNPPQPVPDGEEAN